MEKFTTKQLLKILPMSEEIRNEVLGKFDSLSEDQKLAIKKFCWLMFYQLLNDKTQYAFKKALLDVKEGKGKLKSNLYQEIEKQALKELKKALLQEAEESAVEGVRSKLKQFFRKSSKTI